MFSSLAPLFLHPGPHLALPLKILFAVVLLPVEFIPHLKVNGKVVLNILGVNFTANIPRNICMAELKILSQGPRDRKPSQTLMTEYSKLELHL